MAAAVHDAAMTRPPIVIAIVLAALLVSACGPSTPATPSLPPAIVDAPKACVPAWLSLEPTDVMDVDVVGDDLYWVEYERGRILRMPLAGGAPTVVVEGEDGAGVPEIVVVGDRLVWVRRDGAMWSVKLAGGAPEQVADGFGTPHSLVVTDDALLVSGSAGLFKVSSTFVSRLADEAASLAFDDDHVYVEAAAPMPCANDCRAILRIPREGGAPTVVALTGADVSSMLVHRDRVLIGWDQVRSTAKAGGAGFETDATGVFLVRNLQAVDDRVYFTADNVVYQLRDGAAPIAVAARNPITDLELDGDALYTSVMEVGIRRECHQPDGPPLVVPPRPEPTCKPGLVASRDGFLDTCVDPTSGAKVSYRFWYHSGTVAEQSEAGGLDESFYADGTKRHEARAGRDQEPGAGPSRRWYPTGQLAEEGAYDERGQRHGAWTIYRPDGAVRAREQWEHGTRAP